MRFVKLNNAVIMVGDHLIDYNFDQLTEYGVQMPNVKVNVINDIQYTYNTEFKKNIRLHSKKTQLLLECMHHLNFSSLVKNINNERIGLYIMGSHYNIDPQFPSYVNHRDNVESLYSIFKSSLIPTHAIKNYTGIIPGHIAIFHEIHGPSFVLTTSQPAQIFQKAWIDLQTNAVDLAVVGLVNVYDDPMVTAWHVKNNKRILTEAAGVFLMSKNEPIPKLTKTNGCHYYGYLEGLI